MSKKSMSLKLLAAVLCTTSFYACNSSLASQITAVSEQSSAQQVNLTTSTSADLNQTDIKNISKLIQETAVYDQEDLTSTWSQDTANYITLNGNSASYKGVGVSIKDSQITLSKSGVYVISGQLNDGQITVDTKDKAAVRLVLNGAVINCKSSAPIHIKKAEKTIITLAEGTKNSISDGDEYIFADTADDEPNAAIFSKDDLTINGTGQLTVYGNYNNGITSKDNLKITEGTLLIYSKDDGLMGRDLAAIRTGTITIEAGGDGIKSTNDSDTAKGFIAIEGGTFTIKSGSDGLQAANSILITGGSFDILSGGGSIVNSHQQALNAKEAWDRQIHASTTASNTTQTESSSMKGIKASSAILISGGTFTIDSEDDAVHSNKNIVVSGGTFSLSSGDDGIHADTSILITDGQITVLKSYEGIESSEIAILGGEIAVTASDDGINVAGGNDLSSVNGRPGQNRFSASEDNKLVISGGLITVNAEGDGLDANGSIVMNDGTVIINGPTANGNGALDYDRSFDISGGILIATGSSGMAQVPSETSSQYSVMMNYSQRQQAGTLFHLKDNTGRTLVTFVPQKSYQSVLVSLPELKKDTAYTLYSGGTAAGTQTYGLYSSSSSYTAETEPTQFTISNPITWLTEAGISAVRNAQPGGPGDFGADRNQMRPVPRR